MQRTIIKSQRAVTRKPSESCSFSRPQAVPYPMWPGDKRPLVLTFSDPERQHGDNNDLRLLHHFAMFTSLDLGSPEFDVVNKNTTISLALEHSHLMHAVLAVAATQLRRLDTQNQFARSAEIQHWQHALSSFRYALNQPFTRDNCDAILLSSILLNLMSFSFIQSDDISPLGSWVFSSSPRKLNWLYVQLGLRHLLEQTKPFHTESRLIPLFLAGDDEKGTYSDESPGIQGLPEAFVKVCGLDEYSTPENNPYHSPVRLLAPLLTLERRADNTFKFIHWFAAVDGKFAVLLQQKDHPALLLISYWLAMLCDLNQWWCYERARRECTAICMVLNNSSNEDIIRLLDYPAKACGYAHVR